MGAAIPVPILSMHVWPFLCPSTCIHSFVLTSYWLAPCFGATGTTTQRAGFYAGPALFLIEFSGGLYSVYGILGLCSLVCLWDCASVLVSVLLPGKVGM